jgi:hypothetical protein
MPVSEDFGDDAGAPLGVSCQQLGLQAWWHRDRTVFCVAQAREAGKELPNPDSEIKALFAPAIARCGGISARIERQNTRGLYLWMMCLSTVVFVMFCDMISR